MSTPSNSDQSFAPLLRSASSSTLASSSSQTSISDESTAKIRRKTRAVRGLAFVVSIISALCAGSITVFSLYGHLFQSRLHYTQFQINGIASAMSISMYIPVPVIGYMCDRVGPGPLSLLSSVLLGGGYGLASGLYRKGLAEVSNGSGRTTFSPMILAFVAIGVGTACMYIGAITTCAKNFGKGKYRGLMLVAPIASFGLGGMVLSQIGSRILYETQPGGGRGDVNVFHFFLFLCIILSIIGLIGTFSLRVVDEDDLIDEAVEELERSGLLEGSAVFRRRADRDYGTIDAIDDDAGVMDPARDDDEEDDNAKLKKAWLLNAETRRFLTDHTMWWFAVGFWLIIGPGESFINNMGTVIGTLNSPNTKSSETTAATHVSIMAAVSTVARLVAASLSDLLSPNPHTQHVQTGFPTTLPELRQKLSISRVVLFAAAAIILSIGTLVLASGVVQEHAERFWIVSGSIGAGYGAVFSLTPIIITMIWGVENFGTNFGIVALTPALGSTMWGLIYSAVYQAGAGDSSSLAGSDDEDVFCFGKQCYSSTFWAMTICIWIGTVMILWAWKGRDGWAKRGIVI
ncbi:putative transporter MCH1 [Annulohypoxylon maeteangense]|uniref:putative transporter MCH1 n=1 Tax=Annulohypoxylon maeteangense TaxID=1927788 RepID=UPI002007C40D|nr:putative transporter MCH1 [Annulohypoxylon maeteangense]KAI0884670.1 putative transporter MCH1 [Annulohypoxylon maeteangense]